MLPAHVRCKQQQIQNRMNKEPQLSEANCLLNRQIENQLHAVKLANPLMKQHSDPKTDGSPNFVFGSQSGNRGSHHPLEKRRETLGRSATLITGEKSHLSVLADM